MELIKKLINKHTLSLASNAIMPVMGMITVALLAHYLKATLGNYVIFLMTYTLANFFRTGFLQTALIKYSSGASPGRAREVVGSTWWVACLITLVVNIISLAVYFIFRNDYTVATTAKWFTIVFLCTLPSSLALWVLQAEERFDRVFILQLIGQLSIFAAILILIIIGEAKFKDVLYGYCCATTVTSVFAIVSGWARITTIVHKSKACIRQLFHFGKYSVGTYISSYMLRASDTYIIKFMFVNPAVVGAYYLPQRLMEVIEIPLRSFIATAYPAMASAIQRNDKVYMTYVMKKYAGILTILLIPVSVAAFIGADLAIRIVGGETYANSDAANIFRIFMGFAILMPVDRFFGVTLDILNKPHINMKKVIIMLIVNVAGDFVGIYLTHSLYGVALSSIFTFLTGIIYGYWVLKQNLNFKIRDILTLGLVETRIIIGDLFARLSGKAIQKQGAE